MNTFQNKFSKGFLIVAAIILISIIIFGSKTFFKIGATERAVVFRPFSDGLDKKDVIGPGIHMKFPWNEIYVFNVKEQREDLIDMQILDKKGLPVNIDATVRFAPIFNEIGYIYDNFEMNYKEDLVIPEVRSSIRRIAGKYSAEEIYSTKRSEVEARIVKETGKVLEKKNVRMKTLLIRSIKLPNKIKEAIELKLEQEQKMKEYEYRLKTEKAEAERKKIEAEGVAVYNNIINNSITTNLLKMKGIDATVKLAESNNSKVVVIGSGKDGMPLILGSD